jgi:GTP-binding protein
MTPGKQKITDSESLFRQPCDFVKSVVSLSDLPLEDVPEVAFAGRSNVGKSSLLNALFNVRQLARVSNTPGRTQALNFFLLAKRLYFVDLPGYGFAQAPQKQVSEWNQLLRLYLKGRVQLKRVFLLIDSRHGIKKTDEEILKLLDEAAVSYQVILTKVDKIKAPEILKRIQEIESTFPKHPAMFPRILVTSSQKQEGLEELKQAVLDLLTDHNL